MSNFKEIRNRSGFTQERLADELAIDRSTIAKWESGASLPRADKLPILARVLGCTVDELLGDEDPVEQVTQEGGDPNC